MKGIVRWEVRLNIGNQKLGKGQREGQVGVGERVGMCEGNVRSKEL